MHPRWALRSTWSHCKLYFTNCNVYYTFRPFAASLCVAPRTNSGAIRPSSRLASPAPPHSRCSRGFIHGLIGGGRAPPRRAPSARARRDTVLGGAGGAMIGHGTRTDSRVPFGDLPVAGTVAQDQHHRRALAGEPAVAHHASLEHESERGETQSAAHVERRLRPLPLLPLGVPHEIG